VEAPPASTNLLFAIVYKRFLPFCSSGLSKTCRKRRLAGKYADPDRGNARFFLSLTGTGKDGGLSLETLT